MDTKILEDVGLTRREIKVYISLLETGSSTAGRILENAKVQNSVFHFCVNRLIERGLVSYVKKGKVRIYSAAEPGNLLLLMKDKEKELENLLRELKTRRAGSQERHMVEIFEGVHGITTLLHTLIEGARRGDEFLFFSADAGEKNKDIQNFYRKYDIKRKSRGLVTKGIAPISLKLLFSKRKYLKMKYSRFPVPANTAICNNKMALISWDEKPIGVLIEAKNLVERQRQFFYGMWNVIK